MFPEMVNVLPEGERGLAKVEHFTVSERDSRWTALRGDYVPEGTYAKLLVGGHLVMSDTYMERCTNYAVVRHARGRVLIAGLGLGMILTPILAKRAVESVTVVEKYQDVIDLIGPHFPDPKLSILCADILEWWPAKGEKFDCIYFDIWADKCTDHLKDMARLHQVFKFYKSPGGWMASWCRDELKARKRRESASYW